MSGDPHDDVDHHAFHCDRAAAREARRVVNNFVVPYAKSLGAKLSPSCPLAPEQDHLLPHENQKHAITSQQWRCSQCGKLFRAEHFLDLHLEKKHADLLSSSAHACLGDYCDLLQCPTWLRDVKRHASAAGVRPCKSSDMDARRHFCSHLMHDCFLADGRADLHHIFEEMEQRLCAPLTCAGRQVIIERGTTLDAGADLAAAAGPGGGYYLLGSMLLIGLAFLYGILLCNWGERAGTGGELRRRRRGGSSWFGKEKAF